MSEYINKEKTLEMLDKACRGYGEDCSMGFSLAASIINRLPAADVQPVVRGKWINRGKNSLFPDDTIWACSECDSIYFTRLRFCPYCGADMRELEKYSTDNK